nr:hypothetical protein [Tanacetum cinerariifolium]
MSEPKWAKDVAYHMEKMLLCKQEEARIQLNIEQADWKDDTDDESDDQELEAHYMYMAKIQQVSPDVVDSGHIFDTEPEQKVQNDDHYDVFAIECQHPEQSKSVHKTYLIEQDTHNVIIEAVDMNYDSEQIDQNDEDADLAKERELLASLIEKLKCEIDESKNRNKFLETSNKVLIDKLKSEKLKRRDSIEYASEMELECAKVRAPESDEVIRLEKESRSKLSDLIKPFDYTKLNNLYDLFVPQREKSFEQRFFSERSRISHINVQNEKKKESFQKRTTFLEKRMDESIPMNKNCQSSLEIVNIKMNINTIITGVELCKQKIANRTYIGYIDPFIQNTIKQNFCYYADHMNSILGVYTELDE